jgi:hypothetical protein
VQQGDTVEKIALKWNTIPSDIQHLNRLATRIIFPGQVLYVPDPDYVPPPAPTPPPVLSPTKHQLPDSFIHELNSLDTAASSTNGKENNSQNNNSNNISGGGGFSLFKWRSNPAPKPGHVEQQKERVKSISGNDPNENGASGSHRSQSSRHTITEEEAKQLDEECMQRFIKCSCKIVTRTKGCFEGVLIITPSAIMFDPFDLDSSAAADNDSNSNNYESSVNNNNSRLSSSNLSSSTNIYDEASAVIPIEIISNVIMYEDLPLKDVQEYFEYIKEIE